MSHSGASRPSRQVDFLSLVESAAGLHSPGGTDATIFRRSRGSPSLPSSGGDPALSSRPVSSPLLFVSCKRCPSSVAVPYRLVWELGEFGGSEVLHLCDSCADDERRLPGTLTFLRLDGTL